MDNSERTMPAPKLQWWVTATDFYTAARRELPRMLVSSFGRPTLGQWCDYAPQYRRRHNVLDDRATFDRGYTS